MGHWRTKELTIYVCGGCNLQCEYCYPGDYIPGVTKANEKFVFSGIDYFMIENRDKYRMNKIRFYALGEPTLNIDLIKRIVEYVNTNVSGITEYEIQTNGVFNAEVAKWLADNMSMIWISYDGLPDFQNSQRKYKGSSGNTADIVEQNISIIRQGKTKLGIRPTITNASMMLPAAS